MLKNSQTRRIGAVLALILFMVALPISVKLIRERITSPRAADANAALTFSPTATFTDSTMGATVGNAINVPIYVKTDTAVVRGIDLVINYDRQFLKLESVTPVTSASFATFAPVVSTTGAFDGARVVSSATANGVIDFGAVTFNWATDTVTPAFNGTAQLAILSFTPLATTGSNPTVIAFSAAPNVTTDTNIVAENPVRDVVSSPSTQAFKMSVTVTGAAGPTVTPTVIAPSPTSVAPTPTRTPTQVPPTPTRTPTQVPPSPTPIPPTVTPATTQGSLNFRIKLQGIEFISAVRNTAVVRVILRQAGKTDQVFDNVNSTLDSNGFFNGTVANINPGSYDILIKGPAHLQKKMTASPISISSTTPLQDWSGTILMAGDVTGGQDTIPDNTVQLGDITAILGVWTQSSTAVVPATQIFDLDANGSIQLGDVTAALGNWVSSVTRGDQ